MELVRREVASGFVELSEVLVTGGLGGQLEISDLEVGNDVRTDRLKRGSDVSNGPRLETVTEGDALGFERVAPRSPMTGDERGVVDRCHYHGILGLAPTV